MTLYNNARPDAEITAAEFASAGAGQFAFLHLRQPADAPAIRQWLAQAAPGAAILAQTNGASPILVIQNAPAQQQMLALLQARGDRFAPFVPKKQWEPWKWRGVLSILGQACELTSVFSAHRTGSRESHDNIAYLTYATASLTAAMMEILFGANVEPDKNRLHYLKSQANSLLQPYMPAGAQLPAPDSTLTTDNTPKSTGRQAMGFVRRYAVYIETGLRYFAAFSLAFPLPKLGRTVQHLGRGEFRQAFAHGANKNPFTLITGVAILVGKAFTLFSKTPDPYRPTPPTALDKFRENVTFKLGTVIEGTGTLAMVYNGFMPREVGKGVRKNNPIAGIGNTLFIGGYTARYFAPFGVRKLDMPELQTHIAQGLAQVPPDKLPQLTADLAATITANLKDQQKPAEFGQIFTELHARAIQKEAAPAAAPDKKTSRFAQAILARNAMPPEAFPAPAR